MNMRRKTVTQAPHRFTGSVSSPLVRPSPVSPMVVQHLAKSVDNLTQQVNALAVRQSQPAVASGVPTTAIELRPEPVEAVEVRRVSNEPSAAPKTKVKRLMEGLEMFD